MTTDRLVRVGPETTVILDAEQIHRLRAMVGRFPGGGSVTLKCHSVAASRGFASIGEKAPSLDAYVAAILDDLDACIDNVGRLTAQGEADRLELARTRSDIEVVRRVLGTAVTS